MDTHVNFEIAKLLKEKGFDLPVVNNYGKKGELGHIIDLALDLKMIEDIRAENFNKYVGTYRQVSAPTIAQVVMWIYKKHKIWISISMENNEEDKISFYYSITEDASGETYFRIRKSNYNSPTEAYEAAILYTLKELI